MSSFSTPPATATQALSYQPGFGNHFSSEALPGALPPRQNSPQRAPYGLYAEQISGTAFTAPRTENLRTWVYRIHPSAGHTPFKPMGSASLRTAPFVDTPATPTQLRWDPLPAPQTPTDFIEGLVTMAGNGDAATQVGIAIHRYRVNRAMGDRSFYNADGEMLIVPQAGLLRIRTELGILEVSPGELAVIPRGLRMSVDLPEGEAAGYVCENYGVPFRLPELGPIGSNGLANPRDFLAPVAAYEQREGHFEVVAKFQGNLWVAEQSWSPFDVVAWHGTLAPYKYDCDQFMAISTVSYDHPDPSIYTVLTSPSPDPGVANVDFVLFPSRWLVAEQSFRPPWYHRNVMSEFMGLIRGVYEAKVEGFVPGGCSLHNSHSAHGPDRETYEKAVSAELEPHKLPDTLAFMFESRYVIRPTREAMESPTLQADYWRCWSDLATHFNPVRNPNEEIQR
ncbi:homogentisate 1,2-dioxygenase [Verticiella sediminum]|uniref:Homogentisate 1,2-dioxygenase n=1 Tax=Verticiella sediminum TaxID=1247510 RepID=A0A556ALU7_9BURK|nr:homogentisate 1,2-dioxygenase [Verticiella sediminum]TSH93856.1 homogentisate 1,2-dioxygenase [Verticiella sediminum]